MSRRSGDINYRSTGSPERAAAQDDDGQTLQDGHQFLELHTKMTEILSLLTIIDIGGNFLCHQLY